MNLIVAVNQKWAIGCDNKLMYTLKGDMSFFKKQTMGKVVVMGEKTFLSLPRCKPLNDRVNIILSDNKDFAVVGGIVVHSFEELFKEIKKYKTNDVYLIGGASLYNALLHYCNKAFITKILDNKDGDRYLTNVDKLNNWKLVNESIIHKEGKYQYKFCEYINLNVLDK